MQSIFGVFTLQVFTAWKTDEALIFPDFGRKIRAVITISTFAECRTKEQAIPTPKSFSAVNSACQQRRWPLGAFRSLFSRPTTPDSQASRLPPPKRRLLASGVDRCSSRIIWREEYSLLAWLHVDVCCAEKQVTSINDFAKIDFFNMYTARHFKW